MSQKIYKFRQLKPNTKRPAFTLIEVLTAVFLGTVLVLAAFAVYSASYQSYKRNTLNQELAQNARIALERMTRDIRQAYDIVTVMPLDGTPVHELEFQDGHNSTVISYIDYYYSGQDLHRKTLHFAFPSDPSTWVKYSARDASNNPPQEITDQDQIKAQNISSLQFQGEKTITIDLTVSSQNVSYSFETKSYGRNLP